MEIDNAICESCDDSGTVTPILIAGTSSVNKEVYDGEFEDVYVEPCSHEASSVYMTGEVDYLDTSSSKLESISLELDEESVKLSRDLSVLCNQIMTTSLAQFTNCKKRLISERNSKIGELEARYFTDMQAQEDKIVKLKSELSSLPVRHAAETAIAEKRMDDVTVLLVRKLNRANTLIRTRKVFQAWTLKVSAWKEMKKLEKIARNFRRKHVLMKCFCRILKESKYRMEIRLVEKSKAAVDSCTAQVIQEYEMKYLQMKEELSAAHKQILLEAESRKHFEENLKRIFLKNLTSMNMEAFALFQQQQEIDEGLDSPIPSVKQTAPQENFPVNENTANRGHSFVPPPARRQQIPILAAANMFARVGQEKATESIKSSHGVSVVRKQSDVLPYSKTGIKSAAFKSTANPVEVALRSSIDAIPRSQAPPHPSKPIAPN